MKKITKNNIEIMLDKTFKKLNPIFEEQLKVMEKWESTNRNLFMKTITKKRGDNAELIIEDLCRQMGIECTLTHDVTAGLDSLIKGKKVEIKFSSIGKDGNFIFNQLRPDEESYDYVLFFFLYPAGALFYTVKRTDLHTFSLVHQHSKKTKKEKKTKKTKKEKYDNTVKTYTMSDTKENMKKLNMYGDGSFEDAMENIK